MMRDNVKDYIIRELHNIEKEHGVKILYACESGSRAWGFSNPDSDYDIRFIYIRPLKDYLTLNNRRDVIDNNDLKEKEYTYPLDFSGWDISKALYLHWKSNPDLCEHLKTSITYTGDKSFFDDLPLFNPVVLRHHYGSMTKANWNKYVKNKRTDDFSPRVVKTYCYCIRQIMIWILLHEENLPVEDIPINVDDLFSLFDQFNNNFSDKLLTDMRLLIDYYRSGCKLNRFNEKTILNLSTFIQTYIDIMTADKTSSKDNPNINIYNKRFNRILEQYYDTDGDFYLKCNDCQEYRYKYSNLEQYNKVGGYCKKEHKIGYDGLSYCNDYNPYNGINIR